MIYEAVCSVVTQRPDPVCPSCKGGEQNYKYFQFVIQILTPGLTTERKRLCARGRACNAL